MVEKIILASSSPRRIEILKDLNIKFDIVSHTFNEDSISIKKPKKLAEELAFNKAQSVALLNEYSDQYILGVDTIVSYKNHILGKPENDIEALKFVKMLSGKSHNVISGISLINIKRGIKFIDHAVTKVKFGKIDENFIKFYIDKNHWSGYAGGYAVQGIFSLVVEKIKGTYLNIVGLPVDILYGYLKKIGYDFLK